MSYGFVVIKSIFLIPIAIIKEIYSDPDSYKDYHHQEIRVVSLDLNRNIVTYATGGKSMSLEPFLKIKL
jgi:hypothetical protein